MIVINIMFTRITRMSSLNTALLFSVLLLSIHCWPMIIWYMFWCRIICQSINY